MNNPISFHVTDHFLLNSHTTTHLMAFEESELHSHDFIEFTYVLQGTCLHNYNGVITKIKAGEAFLFAPSDNHQFLNNHSDDFLYRDIIFTFDFFQNICNSYSENLYNDIINKKYDLHFFLSSSIMSELESIIPNILFNSTQETHILMTKVIAKLITNALLSNSLSKNCSYPDWMIKILSFTNSAENMSIPLSTFLKTIPLSQSYMCHEFKKTIGKSMIEYFNEQKIKYAYTLLVTTNYSNEMICHKIGFENISHFYNLFKKIYNTTPAKIRKNSNN